MFVIHLFFESEPKSILLLISNHDSFMFLFRILRFVYLCLYLGYVEWPCVGVLRLHKLHEANEAWKMYRNMLIMDGCNNWWLFIYYLIFIKAIIIASVFAFFITVYFVKVFELMQSESRHFTYDKGVIHFLKSWVFLILHL